MTRGNYKTKAKEQLEQIISTIKGDFSIKDLSEMLEQSNIHIGTSTIYRIVDDFALSGIVKKIFDQSGTAKYQYIEQCHNANHFYLKCDNCGETTHVDCEELGNFTNHIATEHNFKINNTNLFIMGICKKCQGEQNV